jgi:hypothetical protein
METLGMNLTESKALFAGVQDFVVAQQAREELEQRRACPQCRRRYTTKDSGSTPVSTVFGRVEVPNPRWNRCSCQTEGPQTFRPMRTWLNGQTSPEMLYLETKWASLIPFARATDLLKEVLPVALTIAYIMGLRSRRPPRFDLDLLASWVNGRSFQPARIQPRHRFIPHR